MMIFGVAVAPFAEEMLFRGFLYPVLDRWLQTLFMTPRQIRRGCIWILILAGWGYPRTPASAGVVGIAGGLVFLATAALFLARSMKPGGQARLVLLPGAALVAWGLASRSLGNQAFESVTIGAGGARHSARERSAWRPPAPRPPGAGAGFWLC